MAHNGSGDVWLNIPHCALYDQGLMVLPEKDRVSLRGIMAVRKIVFLLGMIVGLILTIAGFTIVIPQYGAFGVFWTIVGILITLVHTYNLFRKTPHRRVPPGQR